MKTIGIISKDLSNKNRICQSLQEQGLETVIVHSAGHFDLNGFDLFIVDLDDPRSEIFLKDHASKCLAFGQSSDEKAFLRAKKLGCDKVYGQSLFFKKILPRIKEVQFGNV